MSEASPAVRAAEAQLEAYNRGDLDAFCACYADDVVVLDADGLPTLRDMPAFRARYATLFERFRDVRAAVLTRVTCGDHVVDHERWSRVDRASGEAQSGEVLARYVVRAGRIALVQFLR